MTGNSLLWKFILIAVVIGVAVVAGYPPEDKIDLGLDLQGGLHILLKVDTSSAVKNEIDNRVTYLGNALTDKNLVGTTSPEYDSASITLTGADPARETEVREVIEDYIGLWDVQKTGPGAWRFTIPPRFKAEIERNSVTGSVETIRNRIDALGVSEPIIAEQWRRSCHRGRV